VVGEHPDGLELLVVQQVGLVDLCGTLHKSTYAGSAIMPAAHVAGGDARGFLANRPGIIPVDFVK
jgi:hypothetical protein